MGFQGLMPILKMQWWQMVSVMTFSYPFPFQKCFAVCALKALNMIEKHATLLGWTHLKTSSDSMDVK